MSKAGYIGVSDIARKIKKMYVGVDGIARKVKKAYVGVDGVARLWFSAGTKITYTGAYMRQSVTNGGTEYNLYTLLTSGTLSVEGDPVEYWMCGGGGGGANSTKVIESGGAQINTVHSTGGGAGAYAESGQVLGNGIAVLIGAGGSADSDGGASTMGETTANGGGAAPTVVYVNNYYGRDAVMGGSGGTGGGSTLVYTSSEVNVGIGGSGDGKSKIPFEISELKAHCAGGGGGGHYYYVDRGDVADGGSGGTNGSGGSAATYGGSSGTYKGGAGGEYGGGAGANASDTDNASNNGNNATFYGGGGGGVAYYETSSKQYKGTTAGKGYQGVVYLIVPKDMDDSEEPVTPFTLTITGASSTDYVKTGGTSYTSATEMYVNNGQEVTVYAYGRYNTIKANGTTVASNLSDTQKTISYTFTVSASTTIAFSSGSATITY